MSKIEWTNHTWNPVVGCSIESSGCKNCYAMNMAGRLEAINATTGKTPQYVGTTKKVKGKSVWTGKIGIAPDSVWMKPLARKKPTMYFVNSEGDLFHPNVPADAIDRAFAVMALSPQHTFQILTKHPERMRDHVAKYETDVWADLAAIDMLWSALENLDLTDRRRSELEWLLDQQENFKTGLAFKPFLWPHVHLGVSVEDNSQRHRVATLLDVNSFVRFVSYEPAIGPLDLTAIPCPRSKDDNARHPEKALIDALSGLRSKNTVRGRRHHSFKGLDWVICGGESGPGARPMHPDWARFMRDTCAAAGVPFFFKQWGAWAKYIDRDIEDPDWRQNYNESTTFQIINLAGGRGFHGERVHQMQRIGKSAAGRFLDGKIHDEFPRARG